MNDVEYVTIDTLLRTEGPSPFIHSLATEINQKSALANRIAMYFQWGFKGPNSLVMLSLVHFFLLDGCDAPDKGIETALKPSARAVCDINH